MNSWKERCNRLQDANLDFMEVTDRLSPEAALRPGACGVWSAREIVCHLAGWDREALARLQAIQADPTLPDVNYHADTFNAASLQTREGMDWQTALEEMHMAHAMLERFLSLVLQQDLDRDSRYAQWVDCRTQDFAQHAEELRRWAKEVS